MEISDSEGNVNSSKTTSLCLSPQNPWKASTMLTPSKSLDSIHSSKSSSLKKMPNLAKTNMMNAPSKRIIWMCDYTPGQKRPLDYSEKEHEDTNRTCCHSDNKKKRIDEQQSEVFHGEKIVNISDYMLQNVDCAVRQVVDKLMIQLNHARYGKHNLTASPILASMDNVPFTSGSSNIIYNATCKNYEGPCISRKSKEPIDAYDLVHDEEDKKLFIETIENTIYMGHLGIGPPVLDVNIIRTVDGSYVVEFIFPKCRCDIYSFMNELEQIKRKIHHFQKDSKRQEAKESNSHKFLIETIAVDKLYDCVGEVESVLSTSIANQITRSVQAGLFFVDVKPKNIVIDGIEGKLDKKNISEIQTSVKLIDFDADLCPRLRETMNDIVRKTSNFSTSSTNREIFLDEDISFALIILFALHLQRRNVANIMAPLIEKKIACWSGQMCTFIKMFFSECPHLKKIIFWYFPKYCQIRFAERNSWIELTEDNIDFYFEAYVENPSFYVLFIDIEEIICDVQKRYFSKHNG